MLNKEAAHHGVVLGRIVCLRAVEGAHGIHPAASGAAEVSDASAIGQAILNLILAVAFDAGDVFDWEFISKNVIHVVEEEVRVVSDLSGCFGDLVENVSDIVQSVVIGVVDNLVGNGIDPVFPGLSHGHHDKAQDERANYFHA